MSYLDATRAGYDATAREYSERFHHHLDDLPVDLAMLSAFAGLVHATGRRNVLDVGCGTGATTAILRDHGLAPTGIDLSPNMIAEARRLNADVPFDVGTMTSLTAADESTGGVCAWYSIIHVPDTDLPAVFAEFARVLAPGGIVLVAFQVGDVPRRLSEAFGVQVDLEFHRRRPEAVGALLADAGLRVRVRTVREPDGDTIESTPQAYLLADRAD
jgi:SAM-dependent methyltransferase